MISKLFNKNFINTLGYIIVFLIGISLILLQQSFVNRKITRLENENKELIKNDSLHAIDITRIVRNNTRPDSSLSYVSFSSNTIYLLVDYPVCSSCLLNVSHFLNAFVKRNGQKLTLLCETKYIRTVKMSLKFENLDDIKVEPLIKNNDLPSKITVIFECIDNQRFCMPLPEKRELNFLETFLN